MVPAHVLPSNADPIIPQPACCRGRRLVGSVMALTLAWASTVGCAGDAPPPNAPEHKASPFRSEQVEGLGNPEIQIENNADVPLTLTLSIDNSKPGVLQVPPHETKLMRIQPGTYKFEGSSSAPSVRPTSGTIAFELDTRYIWTFLVVDPFAGKGWQCFDAGPSRDFFACQRELAECQKDRDETQRSHPEAPISECKALARVWTFSSSGGHALRWFGHDEVQCNRVRATVVKEQSPLSECAETP